MSFEDVLRQSLNRALRTKLSIAVMNDHAHNVVPKKEDVDELLTKAAQLPADRVRGLLVFAVVDDEDKKGYTFESLISGTPNVLEPLLELATDEVERKLQSNDQTAKGEPCPGCGEVHGSPEDFLDQLLRRGPGSADAMSHPYGDPRAQIRGIGDLSDLFDKIFGGSRGR